MTNPEQPISGERFESWVSGLCNKYPVDVLSIMSALCQAGLSKGEISANDIADVHYSDPHVVGATFKLMKRIGFQRTDRIIASTRPKSNSSFILVWQLVDGWRAEMFLRKCRAFLCGMDKDDGQGRLAI